MLNPRGYTLVELLAFIEVMEILAGIAVPVYFHFTDKYK
jgi:Tfp pilus assembly protein PilE